MTKFATPIGSLSSASPSSRHPLARKVPTRTSIPRRYRALLETEDALYLSSGAHCVVDDIWYKWRKGFFRAREVLIAGEAQAWVGGLMDVIAIGQALVLNQAAHLWAGDHARIIGLHASHTEAHMNAHVVARCEATVSVFDEATVEAFDNTTVYVSGLSMLSDEMIARNIKLHDNARIVDLRERPSAAVRPEGWGGVGHHVGAHELAQTLTSVEEALGVRLGAFPGVNEASSH